MPMITATAWVPRGFATRYPQRHQLNQDEYDRISKLANLQLDDAKQDLEQELNGGDGDESDGGVAVSKTNGSTESQSKPETSNDDDLAEYNLDGYDDEPDQAADSADLERSTLFGNIRGLAYHENNEEDPYLTFRNDDRGEISDEDEREELEILPTDNLLLAARVEDEVAHLECYVYEDNADNLYVHHDVMLPAIPLCIEWIDVPVSNESYDPSKQGNFVAVGTMDPDIEIWNLDTVDSMYPDAILGAGAQVTPQTSKKPKKSKKSKKTSKDYHVDAVLALAANRQHRNLLASASADKTVKLWDLNTAKCANSYAYHADKICSLAWNPAEATAMLSGSYDKTVIATDMRAPEAGTRQWVVDSDVEKVAWDPHDTTKFFVSTESGLLSYFDARKASRLNSPAAPIWRLQAHESALATFSVNPYVKGLLATGSDDKTAKLWRVHGGEEGAAQPNLVTSRDLDVGRVFSVSFGPEDEMGYRLAVAGSKGSLKVWDTSTNKGIRSAFELRSSRKGDNTTERGPSGDRVIGVDEGVDDEDESDESEENDEEDGSGDEDMEE